MHPVVPVMDTHVVMCGINVHVFFLRYTPHIRYADLKSCEKIQVGVRIKDTEEWMQVGRIRSENDAFSEVAVARQRALIAEVSFHCTDVCVKLRLSQTPRACSLFWNDIACKTSLSCSGEYTLKLSEVLSFQVVVHFIQGQLKRMTQTYIPLDTLILSYQPIQYLSGDT